MDLKFRAFIDLGKLKLMIEGVSLHCTHEPPMVGLTYEHFKEEIEALGWNIAEADDVIVNDGETINLYDNGIFYGDEYYFIQKCEIMQHIGIQDSEEKDYYLGDIAEFPNGDRFQVGCEDYLEAFVDWIGDAEIEDQARDLYRISDAKIIGNIHQNPELLGE